MPHYPPTASTTRSGSTARTYRGFTLIELLIVVAIIGIVAALITAGTHSVRKGARIKQTTALLKQADTLAQAYQNATSRIVAHTNYFDPGGGRIRSGGNTEDPYNLASRGGARLQEFDWTLASATYSAPKSPIAPINDLDFGNADPDAFKASSIERFLWAAFQRGHQEAGNLRNPVPAVAEILSGSNTPDYLVDFLNELTLEPPGNGFLELRDPWGSKFIYAPFVAWQNSGPDEQRDNYTADDFLPRHDKPFFASPGPDRLWGDAQFQNVDVDGNGEQDHLDNIYSYDSE